MIRTAAFLSFLFLFASSSFADTAELQQHTLTVSKSGEGSGAVSSSDKLINCGTDCSEPYPISTKPKKVTLKEKPDANSYFAGWDGDCAAAGTKSSCTLTMDSNKNATANFLPNPTLTLTKSGDGKGNVKSAPKGVDCGVDCATHNSQFKYKAKAKLTAKADQYSTFLGWSGGACSGITKPKCTVLMDASKNVTAQFGLPDISVSPAEYNFGDVKIKTQAGPVTFTITNDGIGDLKITKMEITGTDAKMFKKKGGGKKTIKPGASLDFSVTFKPTTTGEKTATLKITSNDPDESVVEISLSGADTTLPTTPENLTVTAISSSQINLSWTASTDNVGVTGYKIYRDGTYLKSITITSTSDTGLNPSTQYCYRVSAYDAAGNESVQSSQVCATTLSPPDTTPPSTPAGLTANVVSSSQINLSWTASTDNVGVTGYKVYRDEVSLQSVAGTSTSDAGLNADTQYCYTVSSYDAAGNESAQSTQACAITLVGIWEIQKSGTDNDLLDVFFIDQNNGWAVGKNSTIVNTTDGGTTWSIKSPVFYEDRSNIPITSVYFFSKNEGWLIRECPRYTLDGGDTWIPIILEGGYIFVGYFYNVHDTIFFIDNCGWISTGLFYRTVNLPKWVYSESYPGHMYFTDCSNGWAVRGGNNISHTTNGGVNWYTQYSGSMVNLNSLYFTDKENGWVVGNGGLILNTTDGGNAWNVQISETSNSLHDIIFVNSNTGWIVGDSGTVLYTKDGGNTWKTQPVITTNSNLHAIQFINQNIGWVVGENGTILHFKQ